MSPRSTDQDSHDPEDDDDFIEGSDAAEDETAFCPECGAEIYESADVCPKCFTWIDGDTMRHPPGKKRAAQWKHTIVVWILIAAMAAGLGLFGAVALFR